MHCIFISTHLSNKTESEISISVDFKFLKLGASSLLELG